MSTRTEFRTQDAGKAKGSSEGEVILLDRVSVRYRVPLERVSGIKEYAIRWLQRRVQYQDLWAVNEVSFSVDPGELFGIIGRNGAGKSTLLKVVAGVLRPTKGRVRVRGNVAPLLELGAGFHPELTGRENVFLYGVLLGRSREEMEASFEEIVDFAELWEFIDAPLRVYSSGMKTRLGFAVATNIQPDVLLIDEVLAVGDEAFREKCLQRMNAFMADGTTILLVTHSLPTVEELCARALWLERGNAVLFGTGKEVVRAYRKAQGSAALVQDEEGAKRGAVTFVPPTPDF